MTNERQAAIQSRLRHMEYYLEIGSLIEYEALRMQVIDIVRLKGENNE